MRFAAGLGQVAAEINGARLTGKAGGQFPDPLAMGGGHAHIESMNYILAILLPPLSIFLAGRAILGIIIAPIWILALIFSGGLTHPMFVLLAWFVIFERREKSG